MAASHLLELLVVGLSLVRCVTTAITNPEVTLTSGKLKGIIDDAVVTEGVTNPRSITKFLGVPFAKAPIGKLRFQAPQPLSPWQDVKEAIAFGDMCIQKLSSTMYTQAYQDIRYKHKRISEDCLTLNIFSPVKPEVSQTPLPVMVWVHGGGFWWGTGMNSDGTQLALAGNVIVVTFNYRLNAFGFMSVNDSGASTNNGLRDQIMALQWIKDNIAAFGGDPSKVTIFGNSAGSISVTMLTVSPLARGLFKRAILESGTVFYKHLITVTDGYKASDVMAEQGGCNQTISAQRLTCLRGLSSDKLLQALADSTYTYTPIVPHYGDDVLPAEPSHLFKTGQMLDIDVIIGGNGHDGIGFVPASILEGAEMQKSQYEARLDNTMKMFYPLNSDKVLAAVLYNYRLDTPSDSYKVKFLEAQTDRMLFDFQQTADWLVMAKRNVYFYVFTYTPSVRILPWPVWVYGGHADEIQFVFGDQLDPNGGTSANDEEKTLSRQMMKAWSNFATTGDPNNIDASITPAVVWAKYSKEKREYLEFNINMKADSSDQDYRSKRLSFWRDLVPELASADGCVDADPTTESTLLVNTKQGTINGLKKTDSGQTWEEYLGIPYAAPPMRWGAPTPFSKWSGVRNATAYGPHCYGYTLTPSPDWLQVAHNDFSEDCLFLNVYIPRGVMYVRYMSLPVLIWIHGKAYKSTTSGFFPGHGLALHGNVIVVTINYRMGPIGFLPAGGGKVNGNYGLLDQQMALRWVYKNIENFGGDPKKITLVGQSAGAVAVTLQALAESNKGMIKNVIAESGSPLSPWAMNNNFHKNEIKNLAAYFNCSTTEVGLMVNCLREKSASDITYAPLTVSKSNGFWGPIVDGVFLTKDPMELIKNGALKDINFIIGSNTHDGYEIASKYSDTDIANTTMLVSSLSDIFDAMFVNSEAILSAISFNFLSDYNTKSMEEKAMTVTTFLSSMMYNAPAQNQAKLQTSAGGKVYYYRFRHHSGIQSQPSWLEGNHLDEGYYVMGGPQYMEAFNHTKEDDKLSLDIMAYWTNFAKNGDPNVGYQVQQSWPSFDPAAMKYLELSSSPSLLDAPDDRFWNELVPVLEGNDHDTCPAVKTTMKPEPQTTTQWRRPDDIDEDEACIKAIGPLYLNAMEAHRLLWALGFLVGFLVIFAAILVAYVIYQHRRIHKFKVASRMTRNGGVDNTTFTSSM